jgi:hypothetical protein
MQLVSSSMVDGLFISLYLFHLSDLLVSENSNTLATFRHLAPLPPISPVACTLPSASLCHTQNHTPTPGLPGKTLRRILQAEGVVKTLNDLGSQPRDFGLLKN